MFSGGKDSAVTLDLCSKYFEKVHAAFMYQVEGLSFQEKLLRYYESRYGIEILRIPHFEVSHFMKYGSYRVADRTVPIIIPQDIYNYLRDYFKCRLIASGERIADSIVRRACVKHSGSIDLERGHIYPVAEWKKQDIKEYIAKHRLRLGDEYALMGRSFASIGYDDLAVIREHFPEDFKKIVEWYPFCEAEFSKHERKQISKIHGADDKAQ